MDYFKAVSVKENNLDQVPIKNGQFITVTDTEKSYIDINNTRILLSKLTVRFLDDEKTRKNLNNPEFDILYVILETKSLYIYDKTVVNGDPWINVTGIINTKANDFEIDIAGFTNCILFRDTLLYSPTVNETSVRLENNESLGETLDYINNSLCVYRKKVLLLQDTVTYSISNFDFDPDVNIMLLYLNSELQNKENYKVNVHSNVNAQEQTIYTTDISCSLPSGKFPKNTEMEIIIL